MRFKRLLALLLAAALALSLLAGCGSGQQSAARVLLNLLDGKYPNISVELDPDLEADLRQAISQAEAENAGDDEAAIRAALEKLVGSTVTFRNLGDGQQGDTTFDLVFYAGSDPDKAAQAAYSQWNIVFANVPDDGKYGTGLAMVETDNGIWMLVKAAVEKAGTVDKPDKDDDEPETQEPEKGYTETTDENGKVTGYTVTTADGLKNVAKLVNEEGKTDINITLDTDLTLTGEWTPIGTSFGNSYTGTFDGGGHTITGLKIDKSGTDYVGLIGCLGSGGKVQNVTLTNISVSGANCVGGIAGQNYGTVENCSVNGTVTGKGVTDTGGIAGTNYGTIQGCSAAVTVKDGKNTGGIVGINGGTVTACYSTGDVSGNKYTGGVVGWNDGGTVTACFSTNVVSSDNAPAGGAVGYNNYGTVTACYHVGTVRGYYAGGVVGVDDSDTVYDCYWSGTADSANDSYSNHGIGIDSSGKSHNDNANQVTDNGGTNPDSSPVNWNTALAGLNGQNTGYTFGGDMNNPTLTKNP